MKESCQNPDRSGSCTSSSLSLFNSRRLLPGAAALAFFITHASTWLRRGVPGGLLWACHLGCLLAAIAILARLPALNAVGVLWLALGNLLWAIDLAWGGEFILTSPLTHVGGLLAGLWYARRAGFPRGCWLAALAGLAALHLLSGYVTPPQENINLAFAVPDNLRTVFPGLLSFRLSLLAATAVLFFAVERLMRRIVKKEGVLQGS